MFQSLAKKVLTDIQEILPSDLADLPEQELKMVMESVAKRFNLVTREEFDTQQEILLKTRSLLEAAEQRLTELEQQIASKDSDL